MIAAYTTHTRRSIYRYYTHTMCVVHILSMAVVVVAVAAAVAFAQHACVFGLFANMQTHTHARHICEEKKPRTQRI